MRQFETYQHYRGGLYLKLGEARYTETEEVLVVYVCAVSGDMWARPKAMFEGTLEHEGRTIRRFVLVPYTDDKEVRKRVAVLAADGNFREPAAGGDERGAG